ncbi:MAG: TetR/AcrR family transcriptional regulator [Halieaceae bacterium]|nr:TetR/AcrR family transcriptional regulator [Halieaceae bacterium]
MKNPNYHKGNVREDLIEAAEAVLQEEGVGAVSVRRVAREVGVVPSAVYNHFENREALLAAVAADGYRYMERLGDRMARSADQPLKMIRQLAREYLRFAAENPNLYRLMFSADVIAYRVHPELEQAADASFGRLVEWWYGPGSFDPKKSAVEYPYALSLWSMVHGASMQMIDGHVSVNIRSKAAIYKLADTVVGTLIEGIPGVSRKNT